MIVIIKRQEWALVSIAVFAVTGCGENGLRMGWFADAQNSTPVPVGALPSGPVPTAPGVPVPQITPSPTPSSISPFPGPGPLSPIESEPTANRALLRRVIELTDEFRIGNGLAPLKSNDALSEASRDYAERMGRESFFDHVCPRGTTTADRISKSGYRWSILGENLAAGYQTAEEVMSAWIKSPAHRANLLNPDFSEIGVGYFAGNSTQSSSRYPYWVQEFATPRSFVNERLTPSTGDTRSRIPAKDIVPVPEIAL